MFLSIPEFGIYPDRVIVSFVKINEPVQPGDIVYALKELFVFRTKVAQNDSV